ncbi:MAG TPA: flagellar basal body P-ring formation chaperone FlgA [Rhizomicrobium sp.]|nr:flagellar basal body P-ring formation chaperone FlgA [Rhizomicrobium sp.]
MIRKLTLFFALFAALIGPALADASSTPVRVVVPVRDIARGEVILDSDLTFGTVPGTALMNGTVTRIAAATGMETRRVLRAGEVLLASDLRRPVVVNRGQTVTMTFDAPGVDLTAMGRAMSEGGIGDTVTVQNPASFRMVTAVVIAAGTVRATGPIANGATSQITARK